VTAQSRNLPRGSPAATRPDAPDGILYSAERRAATPPRFAMMTEVPDCICKLGAHEVYSATDDDRTSETLAEQVGLIWSGAGGTTLAVMLGCRSAG
jgi:hypothetical protein